MTTATPATTDLPLPSAALVRRLQGSLVIGALAAAVAATVMLVAPVGQATASRSSGAASSVPVVATPLTGSTVAIEGGDPYVAYGLADSLAGRGASLGAVTPATDRAAIDEETVIVYYDRSNLATAQRIRALLGEGTLRRRQVFEPGVDVTIVLGKDLARP
jgi:hypothetical protein